MKSHLLKPIILSLACITLLAVLTYHFIKKPNLPLRVFASSRESSTPRIQTASKPGHRPAATAVDTAGNPLTPPPPPSLAIAIAPDSTLPFKTRLAVINGLPIHPADNQLQALLDFVRTPQKPSNLTDSQLLALTNDILNVLIRQENLHDSLRQILTDIYNDPSRSPGMRDYALQHLASLGGAKPGADMSIQWTAASGTDPALAATAMQQLLYSASHNALSPADRDRLAAAAFDLAKSDSPAPSRATALQVCGQLGFAQARPLAYDLARSGTVPFILRIAAVATLGDLGGDDQIRRFLQETAHGPEQRLRIPAQSALQRLDKKEKST